MLIKQRHVHPFHVPDFRPSMPPVGPHPVAGAHMRFAAKCSTLWALVRRTQDFPLNWEGLACRAHGDHDIAQYGGVRGTVQPHRHPGGRAPAMPRQCAAPQEPLWGRVGACLLALLQFITTDCS